MRNWICALAALFVLPLQAAAQQRPNVILILVDDLDVRVTRPFYDRVLPTLLRLQREHGVEFTESFVTTPLCCPGRAALLSGRYGHNTNVLNNGGARGGWEQFRDDEPHTVAAQLYRAGYRTGFFGKYLNRYQPHWGKLPPVPWGWTDGAVFIDPNLRSYLGYNYNLMHWKAGGEALNGPTQAKTGLWNAIAERRHYGRKPEDYSTDAVARSAMDFLQQTEQRDEQPFFLYLSPTAPHFPLPPAPRHLERTAQNWPLESFPARQRPNFYQDRSPLDSTVTAIPADRPKWLRDQWLRRGKLADKGSVYFLRHGGELPPGVQRTGYNQADWYNRMGSLYAVDEMLDTLVRWLVQHNEWDHTLILFTSDNGYNLGAHSLVQKVAPYEEALRVPLFAIAGPGLNLRNGAVDSSWVLNIDLMPTILEVARVPAPLNLDGKSLLPLLKAPCETPLREEFLIEYHGPGMANGHLTWLKRLHLRWMNKWYLDMPSYRAIRSRTRLTNDTLRNDTLPRTFLYVEWDRWPEVEALKRKLARNPQAVEQKAAGNPALQQKLELARKKDLELYDLQNDPWQLTNLAFYRQRQYQTLMQHFSKRMRQLEFSLPPRPAPLVP